MNIGREVMGISETPLDDRSRVLFVLYAIVGVRPEPPRQMTRLMQEYQSSVIRPPQPGIPIKCKECLG